MPNDSWDLLEKMDRKIRTACRKMARLPDLAVAVLLWGVGRAATNCISNELAAEDTRLLLGIVLKAAARIHILTRDSPPVTARLEDDVKAIWLNLDTLLTLPLTVGEPVEPDEPAANVGSGVLDLTPTAIADLQSGTLGEEDEDTLIEHCLSGEQQAHRRQALVALRAAGARLQKLFQTLQPLPEPE